MRRRRTNIEFGEHTVTKTAPPELMRVEIEKTRQAFNIGRECKLFRTPEVLDYDEAKGVAVLERIKGIQPFRRAIFKTSQYRTITERVGRSLATIHHALTLPPEMTVALPPEFALPGTEVYLHGDFNGNNVCIDTRTSSVVILDWQMTHRLGGQATYGTRYFDPMWFVNYLLRTPTARYLFGNLVTSLATTFITSYFREAGIAHDAKSFGSYAKVLIDSQFPFRRLYVPWRRRYLLPRSHALTQTFIQSLQEAPSQ